MEKGLVSYYSYELILCRFKSFTHLLKPSSSLLLRALDSVSYHLWEPEEKYYSCPLLGLRGARFTPIEGSEANWIYHCEKHLKSQINTCRFNAFPEEVPLSIAADPPFSLSHLRPCLLYNPSLHIGARDMCGGQWANSYLGPKQSEPQRGFRNEW